MRYFSGLRIRLVGTVFIAVLAGWLVALLANLEAAGFAAGLLALFAAWYSGERFVIRQVRALLAVTRRLATGDFSVRTGVRQDSGEIGELAQGIDLMAEALEARVRERETAERSLRIRAQQQTAVAALGQFALTTSDFEALMNQSVMLVSHTLEVEFCEILGLEADMNQLTLLAGEGWSEGMVGVAKLEAGGDSIPGKAIQTLEAIRINDYRADPRFSAPTLARYHGAISGVTVPIIGRDRIRPFGVLGAHSSRERVFTDDDEQFLRAVANLLAMTADRKRAEGEMHKRAVFAQLNPTPAVEVTLSGEVTYSNDAAFGLAHTIGYKHPRELLPENIIEQLEAAIHSNRDRIEFTTQTAGRTLSWLIHPVPGSYVAHAYITDATERLKLETNLRQADKMLAIGQLAAGVAHDFNNMLTVIQGHAGMLLKKANHTDGSQDSAQAIYFAAERASGLTKQLLMFSRKNVKQLTQLDLRETVQGMSDMLRRLLGETVHLEFESAPGLPTFDGDRNEIEQVVMNLVVNARDAMPTGGSVRILADSVELTESDTMLQPQSRPGSFVRLRVSDTGCGMDQATMQRIFEPFFTTKEVGKGTGLGLATVYGIVKQHHGWIEVASEVGKGTTFSVFLPASSKASSVHGLKTPADAGTPAGGNECIIVEDEPQLREMAVMILESFGYRHLVAGSGPEALHAWNASADDIDLVLTDMIMPGGMSGRDLAKHLIAERPNLPVVIASGYSMDDISDELSGNQNISFVQKPYNLDALARTIRNALDAAKKS
jgi:signal transduction histidine kinase/CheY-like chemotaxis protein/HAMP domain-containing protein